MRPMEVLRIQTGDKSITIIKSGGGGSKEASDAELASEIARSSWWKVQVSQEDVEALAKRIEEMNADEILFVDDHMQTDFREAGPANMHLVEFTKPHQFDVFLDSRFYSKRLDRRGALLLLKSRLA